MIRFASLFAVVAVFFFVDSCQAQGCGGGSGSGLFSGRLFNRDGGRLLGGRLHNRAPAYGTSSSFSQTTNVRQSQRLPAGPATIYVVPQKTVPKVTNVPD